MSELVQIVLVEDDTVDAEHVKRTLRKLRLPNPVHCFPDGVAALDALRGVRRAPLEQPYLILLDLNMPCMNGLEFLTRLRADERLKDSIVFVLTTSDQERDRVSAHERNVAGYIVKSQGDDGLREIIALLRGPGGTIESPRRLVR